MIRSALTALALLAACADETGAPDAGSADARALDATAIDAGSDAGSDAAPAFVNVIESPAEFDRLARSGAVKYLANVVGATPRAPLVEPCTFQDTARFEFHIEFLRSLPELSALTFRDYEALVLKRMTRIWWGGAVLTTGQRHPISGEPGALAYQVYAENGGTVGLREEDIVEVDRILKGCLPYAASRLAFAPGDPFQTSLARMIAARLAQQGIAVLLP